MRRNVAFTLALGIILNSTVIGLAAPPHEPLELDYESRYSVNDEKPLYLSPNLTQGGAGEIDLTINFPEDTEEKDKISKLFEKVAYTQPNYDDIDAIKEMRQRENIEYSEEQQKILKYLKNNTEEEFDTQNNFDVRRKAVKDSIDEFHEKIKRKLNLSNTAEIKYFPISFDENNSVKYRRFIQLNREVTEKDLEKMKFVVLDSDMFAVDYDFKIETRDKSTVRGVPAQEMRDNSLYFLVVENGREKVYVKPFIYQTKDQVEAIGENIVRTNDGIFFDKKNGIVVLYRGNNDTLTIPEEIEGVPVRYIAELAFAEVQGLSEVLIPDSVHSIGERAFLRCSYLEKVTFGNNLKSIGANAFAECNLKEINVPDSVDTIGRYAFHRNSLKNVHFGSGLSKLGLFAFSNNSIQDLDLSETRLETIEYSVFDGNRIETLKLPPHLKIIERDAFAFQAGQGFMESNLDLRSVAYIGENAFGSFNFNNASVQFSEELIYLGSKAFLFAKVGEFRGLVDTKITELKELTFAENSIRELILPKTLKVIRTRAITANDNLRLVEYFGSTVVEKDGINGELITTVVRNE